MDPELIASCGANCNVCKSYLDYSRGIPAKKGYISHCRSRHPTGRRGVCRTKHCKLLRNKIVRFCYECEDFPCPGLKKIDVRYRTRYNVSSIGNLKYIEKNGVRKFLASE
mgnify:CR=1